MISDMAADGDRCQNCGKLLSRNYGGHELYETLRMYDGDVLDAVVADVTCGYCGCINEILNQAWMSTTPNMRRLITEQQRRAIAWAPAMTQGEVILMLKFLAVKECPFLTYSSHVTL